MPATHSGSAGDGSALDTSGGRKVSTRERVLREGLLQDFYGAERSGGSASKAGSVRSVPRNLGGLGPNMRAPVYQSGSPFQR